MQVSALMRQAIESAGTTLEVNIAADLPQVTADARKLDQIFLNILSNAVQSSRRRAARIHIGAARDCVPRGLAMRHRRHRRRHPRG